MCVRQGIINLSFKRKAGEALFLLIKPFTEIFPYQETASLMPTTKVELRTRLTSTSIYHNIITIYHCLAIATHPQTHTRNTLARHVAAHFASSTILPNNFVIIIYFFLQILKPKKKLKPKMCLAILTSLILASSIIFILIFNINFQLLICCCNSLVVVVVT